MALRNAHHFLQFDRTILSNAVALFGSTVATAGLGFAYNVLAARLFDQAVFGLATAAVYAMMLLAGLGLLGLTTLMVGELPRDRPRAGRLFSAALLLALTAGFTLGALFTFAAPLISPALGALLGSWPALLLFALGVALTCATQVFDYAMIGLLRSKVQLWRNIISSAVKVLAVLALALLPNPARLTALLLYSTWTLGNAVSLAAPGVLRGARGQRVFWTPDWSRLRALAPTALRHHALNIAWQAPSWVFPLLVTAFLGARATASFSVAWQIFFLAFSAVASLTTVLYAVNAAHVSLLAQKARFTLRMSTVLSVLACVVLIPLAPLILGIFGEVYAREATAPLRLLVLTVFPLIVKMHFLAIMQVQRHIGRATRFMLLGAALEISGAVTGVTWGGLSGLVIGLLVGQCLEAAIMARTVYGAVKPAGATGDDAAI